MGRSLTNNKSINIVLDDPDPTYNQHQRAAYLEFVLTVNPVQVYVPA